MSCDDIRDRLNDLWEGEEPGEVRRHLTGCVSCAQYRRDLRLIRAGFGVWRSDAAPVPSGGFAQRLVRQLGEVGRVPTVADFFEKIGRRFVYATLVVTFLALLALTIPSTGPVRGLTAADIQLSVQEYSLASVDPIGESGLQEYPNQAPVEAPVPAVPNEVK